MGLLHRQSALCATTLLAMALGFGTVAHAWTLSSDAVAQRVEAYVRERVPQQPEEHVSLQFLRLRDVEIPDAVAKGDVHYALTSTLDKGFNSRAIVKFHLEAPDGFVKDIAVPVRITVQKPVWVVAEKIAPGEALSRKHLRQEMREVTQQFDTTLGAQEDLSPYVARVILRPGEVLDTRKIVIPPVVKRFSDVRIILANQEDMRVTLQGEALDDGRLGETIRVRHRLNGNKYYSAKVIDKNTVLIEI